MYQNNRSQHVARLYLVHQQKPALSGFYRKKQNTIYPISSTNGWPVYFLLDSNRNLRGSRSLKMGKIFKNIQA
jgi:hypothetical protein